MIGAFSYINI